MKTIFLALILCFQMNTAWAETESAKSVTNSSAEVAATASIDKSETTITKATAEAEIPLNLEAPKKSAAAEGVAGKILYTVIVLMMLAGGLFYFLRRYSMPKNSKVQNQIKILSQQHFGPKKSLALVRVAGESILIGITENNINLVKSLSLLDEDIPENIPKSFSATLNETEESENNSSRGHKASSETTSDEDFAISGIKDIVSKRLKSMRNFN